MYQVILRSRGMEITIDSEDDLDLSLDLLDDLANVLNLNKHSIRVTPTKVEPKVEDYRTAHESQNRDTAQADAIEHALRDIGRAATATLITAVALANFDFQTTSTNPQAVVRQVLRKYPRFTQLDRNHWTLTDGFTSPEREADLAWAKDREDAARPPNPVKDTGNPGFKIRRPVKRNHPGS